MNLIPKRLDVLLPRQRLLKSNHIILILILTRQNANRDLDVLCIRSIDESWMALSGRLDVAGIALRDQADDLAAPAEANNAPVLDACVLRLDVLEQLWDLARV